MKVEYTKLVLQEGTADYRLTEWKSVEVHVCGVFYVNGFCFLVVRDPYKPSAFTVIEEKTGRRISRCFRSRSVGAAYDTALDIIIENAESLPLKVELGTALNKYVFHFRSVTPALSFAYGVYL